MSIAAGDRPRAVIVGAGLGGLVAALALQRRGWSVAVYEQTAVLGEVGAGLTLSRGAQSVFRELGILERIGARSSRTVVLPFLHYRTGALLAGAHDRSDDTAPDSFDPAAPLVGRHIHRADLHAILVEALRERAPDSLRLGRRLDRVERAGALARLRFTDGSVAEADLAVGADGIKSVMRGQLWQAGAARFTGQVAYRCLLDPAAARPFLSAGRAAVFLGPGCVFNRYTLRGGTILNCVSLVRTADWQGEGWTNPTTAAAALAEHEGWHEDVRGVLALAPPGRMIRWGLFDRPLLERWSDAPFTLLGDAAHPILPFLGLGAAMAIEDGFVLARALGVGADVGASLARYEAARLPRIEAVARLSRVQGVLLQSQDPDHFDGASAPNRDEALFGYDPVAQALCD